MLLTCYNRVLADESYDRTLWPPGTPCVNGKPHGKPGTLVAFTEEVDKNMEVLSGGEQTLSFC